MGNVMAEALTNFVMTSIAQRKMSILFFTKLHVQCFNMRATSNVESESSTIRRHPLGPLPFHGINQSCVALSTTSSRQMSRREVDAASALDYKIMRPQIVGDILIDDGAKLLVHKCNSRLWYLAPRISSDTFLIKRRYSSPGVDECNATSDSPKFEKSFHSFLGFVRLDWWSICMHHHLKRIWCYVMPSILRSAVVVTSVNLA